MSSRNFTQEQVKKISEIGAHLRNLRTQKGLSIEDVAAKTLIQGRFLEAIEAGDVQPLPETLYVRGFIRRFGEAVGVDGVQLSEQFPLEKNRHFAVTADAAKSSAPSAIAVRPWHLYALYLVGILAAGSALSYVLSRQTAELSGKPAGQASPAATATPKPSPAASPKPSPSPAAAKPKPPAAPVQAKLNITEDAYMVITLDGKQIFEGILKKGESKTYTAQKAINIYTGNAGGVTLSANNKAAKPMGKDGQVTELNLTPQS